MNAAEKLAREIARVAVVREHYQDAARHVSGSGITVNVAPAIHLMSAALEQSFIAAGSNDATAVLTALKDLEGWQE